MNDRAVNYRHAVSLIFVPLTAVLSVVVLFGCLSASEATAAETVQVRFKRTQLDDKFRSEGVTVGDFNRDGRLDIAAGFVWYEAPHWNIHAIVDKPPSSGPNSIVLGSPLHYDPKKYANSFCTFTDDLNGDGWDDLIVVDFPGTPTWWFENPQGADRSWTKHTLTSVTNNESPAYLDVDGDGRRELIAAFSPDGSQPDGPDRQMAYFTRGSSPDGLWTIHPVSVKAAPGTRKYSHGLGVGDVNGDGRNDILCADGWWEAPASSDQGLWDFHAVKFGEHDPRRDEQKAAQMFVYDFDGDGDSDVLSSSPHGFGIWWHEQISVDNWKAHEIDMSFSQTHGVCLADINGDSLPDFVTGKRWWAHGGRDPGGDQPAVFCWFELSRAGGRVEWIRHQFDHNSGPGTQFVVIDVNADGLLDIVTSNKKGVHYFEQVRD